MVQSPLMASCVKTKYPSFFFILQFLRGFPSTEHLNFIVSYKYYPNFLCKLITLCVNSTRVQVSRKGSGQGQLETKLN